MKEKIQQLSGEEAIRKRPGMYLGRVGSKGLINLVKGIFLDSVEQLNSEQIFFHFTIVRNNQYQIVIKSDANFTELMLNPTTETEHLMENFHFSVLKALSDKLNIKKTEKNKLSNKMVI